jgi:two-component system sensor histidine kinase HydH
MIYTTHQNSQAVRSLARTSLESTALALSMAAENALRRSGTGRETEIREILSDRVVAYALIARHDDTILFHTNPTLVGTKLHDNDVKQQLAKGNISSREITLGTGIPAYEFNFTLHHPDGSEELLRLILHTSQADLIVSRAERMWWLVGIMLALLWTAGLLLERTATRYIRLQAQQEEQKRLTLIGQMTAVLAHEIRNALASIKGYAQWVNEKTAESEPSKPAMAAILQSTGRIESLVNEILLFSKQETYTIEPVGIAPLMDEAAGSGLTGWQGKTEIEIDPGILVMADREKLLRTLVNGMRNAVDAMGGDGVLHIGVSAEGRWVTLRIEDSGPGISAEEVPHLFTPFYTTKTEGTGLGLAYAKKVVEGMGGIINLENRKYKQGAILSIKLPAS